MLTHTDLKKGVKIILEGQPYEVLESTHMKKAQRRVVIQTKVRNLITGVVLQRNFHQGETFKEAEITKFEVKFLYYHRGSFFFSKNDDPSKRFSLEEEKIPAVSFLKTNQIAEAIQFEDKIISVSLPVKVQLKVTEAPPGVRGGRAEAGNKVITLETGAKINAPLFVKEGDFVEVNTETGEYVRRV